MRTTFPRVRPPAIRRARSTALILGSIALLSAGADAATLAEKAKESGCTKPPKLVEGATYKCETHSGASYFNVPDMTGPASSSAPRPASGGGTSAVPAPRSTGNGFPRVDPETQKGRDDVRRRVLQDELAAEEKLLVEARAAYGDGAPVATPEERANPERYRERIARLRQALTLHERNIEALKKEIGGLR